MKMNSSAVKAWLSVLGPIWQSLTCGLLSPIVSFEFEILRRFAQLIRESLNMQYAACFWNIICEFDHCAYTNVWTSIHLYASDYCVSSRNNNLPYELRKLPANSQLESDHIYSLKQTVDGRISSFSSYLDSPNDSLQPPSIMQDAASAALSELRLDSNGPCYEFTNL